MSQQSVPIAKYSPNDEIQNFLTRRKKGDLLTQKTRRMFSNLLREIHLSEMEPYIRFGDVVQLIPTNFKISKDYAKIRPALSLVVTEKSILKGGRIDVDSEVTVSPSIKPCMRNSFRIGSYDTINRDGEILKYGQNFVIESMQDGCPKYVLFCSPKSANLSTVFEPTNVTAHGGEMNLPVGVCEKTYPANLPKIPCGHTRWRCQHLNPSLRFEFEGEPVPSNTRLVITHAATNVNLAAENVEFQSFFGNECLVSVHDYKDRLKRVQWQNIWCIKKGDAKEPIK